MNMNDDYLWDGSGEPDPEIEKLEELLGRFRHEGKAPEMPLTSRRIFWPRLAVAAAVIVMLLAGAWLVLNRGSNDARQPQQAEGPKTQEPANQSNDSAQAANKPSVNQDHQPSLKDDELPTVKPKESGNVARAPREKRGKELTPGNRNKQAQDYSAVALADFETTSHLESAQMLLRSFRNIGPSENEQALDVSYEKERSRELLYRNIMLRRNAEAKGNLPITDLLGTLEPILLDIANMADNSPQADVRSIQERIERKEIVATLQVYSAPVMGMALRQR